jgi:heme-degrading monooxygenase HmoA
MMSRIASFHLTRWRSPLSAMASLGRDRLALRSVEGLEFWRLLGTGKGNDTSPSVDARRTAMFAVWSSEADYERFVARHRVAHRWVDEVETWSVRMKVGGGGGAWRGVRVADRIDHAEFDGPVAVITRANVRLRSWRAFGIAGGPVNEDLHRAEGLIDVVGIGEAPVGKLATFSLWQSADHIERWAYGSPEHLEVMRRTRDEAWYSEEMFVRFVPYASVGTWDGRDPLG